MLINKVYRYELKLNNKQITQFKKCCGVARFAWNWGLARHIYLYDNNDGINRFISKFDLQKEFDEIKRDSFGWVYEVSKSNWKLVLRNSFIPVIKF